MDALRPKRSATSLIRRRLLHDFLWIGLPAALSGFGLPAVPVAVVASVVGAVVGEAEWRRSAQVGLAAAR